MFPINQINHKELDKPYLLGLALGLAPIVSRSLLYYVTPYLVDGNAGALLSFAVLGLFMISSVAVFAIAIIFMNRNFRIIVWLS